MRIILIYKAKEKSHLSARFPVLYIMKKYEVNIKSALRCPAIVDIISV